MERNPLELICYYQNEEYATVLIVDHQNHHVKKVVDSPVEKCEGAYDLTFVSKDMAMVLLEGFARQFYIVEEINYEIGKLTNEQKHRFSVYDKVNKKVGSPEYQRILEQEEKVYQAYYDAKKAYMAINDRHLDLLQKCDLSLVEEWLKQFNIADDMPEAQKTSIFASIAANADKNGYKEIVEKLLNDENYVEVSKLEKQLAPAFFKYLQTLIDVEAFKKKEYDMFSNNYKKVMDEYASKGLFLYWLNTPDLPIDDKDVSIDDIYNYILEDNGTYLQSMIESFVRFGSLGEINKREADDLVASFHLLNEGKYWAALRNLYALIDHHHKLCASVFNGYKDAKLEFNNGAERAEYVTKLIDVARIPLYRKTWNKLNSAFKEMNSTKGPFDRFVSRNAVVHGDYENESINPTAKDVLNVFTLYISFRKMTDDLKNIEEAIKEFNLYALGYAMKH